MNDPIPVPDKPCLARRTRLQYEQAQQRWVLLYPEGMVQLNPSAAAILQRCTGERTVDGIVDELEAEFAVHGIGAEVKALIEEGTRRGWIV